jgi:hypothetical protein
LYYLDFEVFNFHGLAPEGLGPPVQRLHVLVIQVDRLVTVRDHQLQILEKNQTGSKFKDASKDAIFFLRTGMPKQCL